MISMSPSLFCLAVPPQQHASHRRAPPTRQRRRPTRPRLCQFTSRTTRLPTYPPKPPVDLIGFSRGAQVAHRFALFFPEDVDRVVAFSAGTYTMPYRTKDIDGDGRPDMLALPYGSADFNKRLGHPINPLRLKQVRFLIGVGSADNSAGDVPHQWDVYEGKTRLERALEFADALRSQGVRCSLQVFPGVGHEVTRAILNQPVQFL